MYEPTAVARIFRTFECGGDMVQAGSLENQVTGLLHERTKLRNGLSIIRAAKDS